MRAGEDDRTRRGWEGDILHLSFRTDLCAGQPALVPGHQVHTQRKEHTDHKCFNKALRLDIIDLPHIYVLLVEKTLS